MYKNTFLPQMHGWFFLKMEILTWAYDWTELNKHGMTMEYLVIKREFGNSEIWRFENHSLFILQLIHGWFYWMEIPCQARNDNGILSA